MDMRKTRIWRTARFWLLLAGLFAVSVFADWQPISTAALLGLYLAYMVLFFVAEYFWTKYMDKA
jgi:hypothetical protein